MTIRLSRRLFLGGAAVSAAWHAAGRPSRAVEAAGLLLVILDAAMAEPEADAAPAVSNADLPTLVVGERLPADPGLRSPAARVSWGALELFAPDRLADLLRGPAPMRIAAAAGDRLAPNLGAWARLGRLMAQPLPFACLVVDPGGTAAPSAVAKGIDAFRESLGTAAAAQLVVRRAGRPVRYG